MRTIKSIIASIVVIALSVLYVSCDPIDLDKFTTVEIPLDVSFELPFDQDAELKSASEETFSIHLYGKSDSLNINNSIFDDLKQYENNSIRLTVNSATVIVVGNENGINEIKDFTSSANNEITSVGAYQKEGNVIINKEFTDSKLADYFKAIIQSIQDNHSVIFDVSGYVVPDLPEAENFSDFPETKLKYSLKVSLSITAQVNIIK
jgi:hypothetical protein